MTVDMSPQAVKARMQLMDELWELSVKLMNSRIVDEGSRTDLASQKFESAERKTDGDQRA